VKKFFFDCGTRETSASAGLLILRVGFGLMMLIGHGWGKIAKFQEQKDAWPVPDFLPFSWLTPPLSMAATIVAEVGCAALLVLGLATRPAAFVLGFTMVVGAFQVHAADPFFMAGGASKEPALLYLIPCLALIAAGAGAYSIDAQLHRERRRKLF
jgi:putative oxidoreductase